MSEIRMRYIGRSQAPFGKEVNRWEVIADESEDKVMEFCKREICSNRPVMTLDEWEDGINSEDSDMDYSDYIKGYVTLNHVGDGRWWFEKHFPNLD